MAIVGFTYNKILIEKSGKAPKGQITIKNNSGITDISKVEISIGNNKQDVLRMKYQYMTDYSDDLGKVDIQGELLYLTKPEEIKHAMDMWHKEKKIPAEIMQKALTHVMEKCTIQSIILTKDVGLPSPIQLPRVVQTPVGQAKAPEKKEDKTAPKKTKK